MKESAEWLSENLARGIKARRAETLCGSVHASPVRQAGRANVFHERHQILDYRSHHRSGRRVRAPSLFWHPSKNTLLAATARRQPISPSFIHEKTLNALVESGICLHIISDDLTRDDGAGKMTQLARDALNFVWSKLGNCRACIRKAWLATVIALTFSATLLLTGWHELLIPSAFLLLGLSAL